MSRVDSILATTLFTNNNFRGTLIAFIETSLGNDLDIQGGLNNIPYSAIFNKKNILKEEISLSIRDAKPFIGFDHNSNDKILQNLIFLFLVFSINEYPSNIEWQSFLNQPNDVKRIAIRNGIKKIWMSYQEQIIENNLNSDTIIEDDPF